MRTCFALILLAVLALVCVAARGEDAEESIPARVLCDGGRLAAIQVYVPAPGVITLRFPTDICGRTA